MEIASADDVDTPPSPELMDRYRELKPKLLAIIKKEGGSAFHKRGGKRFSVTISLAKPEESA